MKSLVSPDHAQTRATGTILMLVRVAVAARFRPATNSRFKPESRTNRENKAIVEELLVRPPSGAGPLRLRGVSRNSASKSSTMIARPRGEKRLDCKCHVRRRVSL